MAYRQGRLFHIAHHAHDNIPGPVGGAAKANAPPNGVLAGVLALCERFVYQHWPHRQSSRILRVEQAPAAERNAHRFKVAGRHSVAKRILNVSALVVILELDTVHVSVAAQRQLGGERRRRHSGHALDRFKGLSEETIAGGIIVESAPVGLHLHGEQV